MAYTPRSPLSSSNIPIDDLEAQDQQVTHRHRCRVSKNLVDSILILIAALAVSVVGVVLLLQGAGGIGSTLFAAFVSGGLVWMNIVYPVTEHGYIQSLFGKGDLHWVFNAPKFETTNHVFLRALACTICMYGATWENGNNWRATWEHGNRQLFVASGVGFIAVLLNALLACTASIMKFRRRSSPGQTEAEHQKGTAEEPDVFTGAAQSALEKGHKKMARAKTAELKSVEQPEARAGDGDARSLSNLPVVASQALAFFQMLGMSLELQVKIPGLAMPPIIRLLSDVLPVFTFETLEMPIPETAAVVLRILAPVVLLWSWYVQVAFRRKDSADDERISASERKRKDFKELKSRATALVLQFGPFLVLLIISGISGEIWGVIVGAVCSALIVFSILVKWYFRRPYAELGQGKEFDFMCLQFDAHVLLLLYGTSYLGPLRALTGLYMSDASTPATGWSGMASGTVFTMLVTFRMIQIVISGGREEKGGRDVEEGGRWENMNAHFKASVSNYTNRCINFLQEQEKAAAEMRYYRNPSNWILLGLLIFSAVPFLAGLGTPVHYELLLVAASGVLFAILPLVVLYFWNLFNEKEVHLEDPYLGSRRFVASLLPLERAVGIGIVELLISQPDVQLVLFFAAVAFFLLLLLISKPYNEREDFFNDLALRCSVAVVAAVAVDMRFGFGMTSVSEAAAVGVSVAGVLWVLVALKPLRIPRAFFASIGSAYGRTTLDIAISKGDMKQAAGLLLDLSAKGATHTVRVKLLFLQAIWDQLPSSVTQQKKAVEVEPNVRGEEVKADLMDFMERKQVLTPEGLSIIDAVVQLLDDKVDEVKDLASKILRTLMMASGTAFEQGNQDVIDRLLKVAAPLQKLVMGYQYPYQIHSEASFGRDLREETQNENEQILEDLVESLSTVAAGMSDHQRQNFTAGLIDLIWRDPKGEMHNPNAIRNTYERVNGELRKVDEKAKYQDGQNLRNQWRDFVRDKSYDSISFIENRKFTGTFWEQTCMERYKIIMVLRACAKTKSHQIIELERLEDHKVINILNWLSLKKLEPNFSVRQQAVKALGAFGQKLHVSESVCLSLVAIHGHTLNSIVSNDVSCIADEEKLLRSAEEAIGKIDAPEAKKNAFIRVMYLIEQPATNSSWNPHASKDERERDRPRFEQLWKDNLVHALGVLAPPGERRVIDKLLEIMKDKTYESHVQYKDHERSQSHAMRVLGTVLEPRRQNHGVQDSKSYEKVFDGLIDCWKNHHNLRQQVEETAKKLELDLGKFRDLE
eukprot:gnl/MRDRNA2_/MRDRNA2_87734_c0_seq1.p1 gnl/MRDRNA2_/MRDRNA2_87734_c0~~gnl/MRDRNA2_/MRDRNA2_87734_c0_seq1.p1  ORF type:complete len:1300 (-),score=250.51 gnl/MRDRNA2_/MRDRNA2_87734_c0_seq1:231-4028(-)